MSGVGQRLRLRLFLEGVEVPVIAADVQSAPNSPVQASIQIPPMPTGMEFLPRTLVHLFFLDPAEIATPFIDPSAEGNLTDLESTSTAEGEQIEEQQHTAGDDPDLRNSKYKLLFGGEIVGFQWTKNQAQRSLVLQCQDWSNYWDYAYQWNNTDIFGPGIKAMFSGGSTNLFTDFLEEQGTAILRIISEPSVQYPQLKGLLGGIVHLLEAVGGSYFSGKTFAGENIFFSIAELRLHITQMIVAYEGDPTASRLINAGYDQLLGRTLGGLGQQVSIRQAINALMAIIFHETYAQPCPYFVPGSGNSPSGKTRTNIRNDPRNAFIAKEADVLLESIDSIRDVIKPDAVSQDSNQVSLTVALSGMEGQCRSIAGLIKDKKALPARSFYGAAQRAFHTAAAKSRGWQPALNAKSANTGAAIGKALDDAEKQLKRAAEFEATTTNAGLIPARLNQHIFRPDVWFSAPPRCNVFFPDQYHTLTYSRQFLAEPTRLLLKTNDEFFGEDELFDQFYFAPKGTTLKSDKRELLDILQNDLMDHELFTGILPVFEKMGELNIFGARDGNVPAPRTATKTAKGKKPGPPPKSKTPKIGLAQRSCNFLYFKYRFAARQLQLAGRFNPYVACGFPALIIDRYVNEDLLKQREALIAQNGGVATKDINDLLGTHFLANLTEVSHSVSQGFGSTSINCSYARTSNETKEFLGVFRADQLVQKRAEKDAVRTTTVAAIEPPQTGTMGPLLGSVIAVQEVTNAHRGDSFFDDGAAQTFELYQGPVRVGTTQARVRVPIGLKKAAQDYSPDVVELVGNPLTIVTFRAFKVTEEIPRYRKETVDLPPEEYIRPGWYGDIWHPAQIGKAYEAFFGTGAITDETVVQTAQAASSVGVDDGLILEALAAANKATDAGDPSQWAAALARIDANTSVSAAVSFLVQMYSYAKQQGTDVDEFIRTYTYRPIATMIDMFGTNDLEFDSEGHAVLQGTEGFHSRAFSENEDLFGLLPPDMEKIIGVERGTPKAGHADTRARKRRAVKEYVSAISLTRAILC